MGQAQHAMPSFKKAINLKEILQLAIQKEVSDIHLQSGYVPSIRVKGEIKKLSKNYPPLTTFDMQNFVDGVLSSVEIEKFERLSVLDFRIEMKGVGRFRANLSKTQEGLELVLRRINDVVLGLDELNLPESVRKAISFQSGLVLITGKVGSGKSSTMAAVIKEIAVESKKHILTVEDPIEYILPKGRSIISQKEIGTDVLDYVTALKSALRQDPDVLVIGEMRDEETIEIALSAAETGHLVISTLHTVDAVETINRIIGLVHPSRQENVREQLASVLKMVVSQKLLTRQNKAGVIPCVETMTVTARIRKLITQPLRTRDIRHAIEQGKDAYGMQSFDQSLVELCLAGEVSKDVALVNARQPEDFVMKLKSADSEHWKDLNILQVQNEEDLPLPLFDSEAEKNRHENPVSGSINLAGRSPSGGISMRVKNPRGEDESLLETFLGMILLNPKANSSINIYMLAGIVLMIIGLIIIFK